MLSLSQSMDADRETKKYIIGILELIEKHPRASYISCETSNLSTKIKQSLFKIIPLLRCIGYSIIVNTQKSQKPFLIMLPGHAPNLFDVNQKKLCLLRSTSPNIMKMRGFIYCLPKLIRWKHRSLKYFFHQSVVQQAITQFNEEF